MATELEPRAVSVYIGSLDASSSQIASIMAAPCDMVVTGADIMNQTAVSLHSANYGDYNIQNKGTTGSGTTEVASLSTKSGESDANALAASKAEAMTVSSTASNLEISEGEALEFKATESGTATSGDLTKCTVTVYYVPGTGKGQ